MTYVITELCTLDGSCVEVCPVACIHTRPDAPQYYIDPDVCIECEQCEIVCPVDAIFVDWRLPEEHRGAIEVNASFFRKNKAAPRPVSVERAFEIVRAAQAYATEIGAAIAVAVTDQFGWPIAVGRMEGAAPWTPELAVGKAYSAVNFRLNTQELRAEARRPWFRSLVVANQGRIIPAAGGLPIIDGVTLVGAVGVAGGRREEEDVLCARAGLGVLEEGAHAAAT